MGLFVEKLVKKTMLCAWVSTNQLPHQEIVKPHMLLRKVSQFKHLTTITTTQLILISGALKNVAMLNHLAQETVNVFQLFTTSQDKASTGMCLEETNSLIEVLIKFV